MKKHPILFTMIVLQTAFILALIVSACITPRKVKVVDMTTFRYEYENIVTQNGVITFSERESVNDENWLTIPTDEMNISSGAYQVEIIYDSYVNQNRSNESNGEVTMSSRWHINFEPVVLDDQHNVVYGKLWIPFLAACEDLRIHISYKETGTLSISSIILTEALRYRAMRILGFLIFFAVIDAAVVIFYSDIKLALKKEQAVLLLIIIAASLPFCARVLFNGHDLWFHLQRIASVAEEIGNGQFPVRMATEVNNGYGYPLSIYYCDLFLYPVAILHRWSVPLRTCYQIYVIAVNTATTIFTYISLGKITKSSFVRLLGTGLYVLCIYRLVNVNVRAAVGEYTAMAFLPLVVAGLYLIYTEEKPVRKDWFYLSAGMSGILLSHVLTGLMVVINVLVLCLISIKKVFKKEIFLSLVKAAMLCFGITAWFFIPFLDYLTSHETVVQKGDFRSLEDRALELVHLFQFFAPGDDGEYYLTIGMPLILGIGFLFYCLANHSQKAYREGGLLRCFSGFAFLNIAFVSQYFPWGRIQRHLGLEGLGYQLGTIQFPWRFLSIASVILVFAIVVALNGMEKKNYRYFLMIGIGLICSIVLSVGFFYYKYVDNVTTGFCDTCQPYRDTDNLYLLNGTDRAIQYAAEPEILQGKVVIDDYGRNQSVFKMYVENKGDSEAIIRTPVYHYKYFQAYDENGGQLEEALEDKYCLTLKIPAYFKGEVEVKFEPPFIWRAAEGLSFLCILIIVGRYTHNRFRKHLLS